MVWHVCAGGWWRSCELGAYIITVTRQPLGWPINLSYYLRDLFERELLFCRYFNYKCSSKCYANGAKLRIYDIPYGNVDSPHFERRANECIEVENRNSIFWLNL